MSSKQDIINTFDPSQPGLAEATIYGLPFSAEQSDIIILPVPWEVTVSYGAGASLGPDAVLQASYQVDLLHQKYPELWKLGIYMDQAPEQWMQNSEKYKALAKPIIEVLENGENIQDYPSLAEDLKQINQACDLLNQQVEQKVTQWLEKGKKVVLLGGDHSTPLGYYKALAKKYSDFGILHFDAHMDLREAYEGFTYSHASIMYNTLKQIPQVSSIVQVGIRDFCESEVKTVQDSNQRVLVHTDSDLKQDEFEGVTWKQKCQQIIDSLPEKVVISFDIDGLLPWYCPNTGTPVPGGLSFEQATYMISLLAQSGKVIIGMDLVEVAPSEQQEDDWDGNVGARLLFHMCGAMAESQKMAVGQSIVFQK
ncbi:agmatinase family protein [Myroides sp. LJL119]